MRIVGKPVVREGFEALEYIDRLLDGLELPDFRPRGVMRLTHAQMNQMDDDNARKRREWVMSHAKRIDQKDF